MVFLLLEGCVRQRGEQSPGWLRVLSGLQLGLQALFPEATWALIRWSGALSAQTQLSQGTSVAARPQLAFDFCSLLVSRHTM